MFSYAGIEGGESDARERFKGPRDESEGMSFAGMSCTHLSIRRDLNLVAVDEGVGLGRQTYSTLIRDADPYPQPIRPVNRNHRRSVDIGGVTNALAIKMLGDTAQKLAIQRSLSLRNLGGAPPARGRNPPIRSKKKHTIPSFMFLPGECMGIGWIEVRTCRGWGICIPFTFGIRHDHPSKLDECYAAFVGDEDA